MKLCEEFLKEMGLENAPILERAIACEMLKLVIIEPTNARTYGSFISDDSVYFTDDILNDKTFVKLLDVCGYWSNDIADILADSLVEKGIESSLANKGSNYRAIFSFLDDRLEG